MKKVISIIMTGMLILSSMSAAKKSLELEPITFDLPSEKGEEFIYSIDPRIEVIGTICRLAGYQMFNYDYNTEGLLSQNDLIFEKYKEHKAVKAVQNYRNQKKISSDAWINFAYHLKPDFSGTIVDINPYPEDLYTELKKLSAKQFNTLVTLVHDFVVDTNYTRIIALNHGTYISDFLRFKEWSEKEKIHTWGKDFFNCPEVSEVTVTISRYVCGYSMLDFAAGENKERKYYLTVDPNTYLSNLVMDYSEIYCLLYSIENWDKINENFTKYIKEFSKKANPEMAKEIEKEEINCFHLAQTLTPYCYSDYLKYRAKFQTEEDIEKDGDFNQYVDSLNQYLEKSYGKDATDSLNLLEKYSSDKAKYSDFKSLYPELNELINGLKVE